MEKDARHAGDSIEQLRLRSRPDILCSVNHSEDIDPVGLDVVDDAVGAFDNFADLILLILRDHIFPKADNRRSAANAALDGPPYV